MKKEEKKSNKEINIFSEQDHLNQIYARQHLTFGQKAADTITKFGGSWTFILIFILFLIFWVFLNSYLLIELYNKKPFDPFPFILLNLFLSTIAAIQAPIILMSQNRANQRDRMRTEYDYAVDRKAEKEIREIKSDLELIKKKLNIHK